MMHYSYSVCVILLACFLFNVASTEKSSMQVLDDPDQEKAERVFRHNLNLMLQRICATEERISNFCMRVAVTRQTSIQFQRCLMVTDEVCKQIMGSDYMQ